MANKIGNKDIIARYIGNNKVIKQYLGTTVLYEESNSFVCDGTNIQFTYNSNYIDFKVNDSTYTARVSNSVDNGDGTYTYSTALPPVNNISFRSCSGLTELNCLPNATPTDMSYAFNSCTNLQYLDLTSFNTSGVTIMDYCFSSCKNLTHYTGLENLDVSNVYSMTALFSTNYKVSEFNIKNWDMRNIKYVDLMFANCSGITSIDLSGWNTSNLINMTNMFQGCSGLLSVDLSGWNISNLREPSNLFDGCTSLKTINLTGWKITENWKSTTNENVFKNCNSLETIILGETDQTTYDWVYGKLVLKNLQDQVTIIYSIV